MEMLMHVDNQIVIEGVKEYTTCPYCKTESIHRNLKSCPNCHAKISYKKEDLFIDNSLVNFLFLTVFVALVVMSWYIFSKFGWLWSVGVFFTGMWVEGVIINLIKRKKITYKQRYNAIFQNPHGTEGSE
jgi:hypothetical protein